MVSMDLSLLREDPTAAVPWLDEGFWSTTQWEACCGRQYSLGGAVTMDLTCFREPIVMDLTDVRDDLMRERAAASETAVQSPAEVPVKEPMEDSVQHPVQDEVPVVCSTGLKECSKCREPWSGASSVCGPCRKVGPRGSQLRCTGCEGYFQGHGSRCHDCRQAVAAGSSMMRSPSSASTCASISDLRSFSTVGRGASVSSLKQCSSCKSSYNGFGNTCSGCRKFGCSSQQCSGCQTYGIFFGHLCTDCRGKEATDADLIVASPWVAGRTQTSS